MNQRIKELHEAAEARGVMVCERAEQFAKERNPMILAQALREAKEHASAAVKEIFIPMREEMVKLGFDEAGASVYVTVLNRVICQKQREQLLAKIRSANG